MPKVQMPQLGESVAEGTIGKWLKKPGDHVDKYEPIVEVITDKVNAEVPSPFEGTLTEILVQEGETVPNNTEIAVIESAGASAGATDQAPAPVATAPAPADEPAATRSGRGSIWRGRRPRRFRRTTRAHFRATDSPASQPNQASLPPSRRRLPSRHRRCPAAVATARPTATEQAPTADPRRRRSSDWRASTVSTWR